MMRGGQQSPEVCRPTRVEMPPALASPQSVDAGMVLALIPAQLQGQSEVAEDLAFLKAICGDRSMQSLLKVHENLKNYLKTSPMPVVQSGSSLMQDLLEELQIAQTNGESRELLELLAKPHVQALLTTHDTVARKDFLPTLPPLPNNFEDVDEETVKIVHLVKNKEPLGATIKRHDVSGAIVIARIMRGGAADRSGLIHMGDELKEVNGVRVDHKEPEEVIQILAQSQNALTFKIIPALKEDISPRETKLFLHALFDYQPSEDPAIPCREAGLAFSRGDVLQVVSQDDVAWWQARHTGGSLVRAGLIPSKLYMERRLASKHTISPLTPQKKNKSRLSGLRRSFRQSLRNRRVLKSMFDIKRSGDYETPEPPTYEEVIQYQRMPPDPFRLVVLVGPPGVGIGELKRKLVASNPEHYEGTVPTTTRQKKSQEEEGKEYHFVTRHVFDTDLQNNRLVEHGEYKGNLYGTTVDSIRAVMIAGKVCVLDAIPQAIKAVRTSEFKPYVVFVKPSGMEKQRDTRTLAPNDDGKDARQTFVDEELQEMISAAEHMGAQYGYLFDLVLVNDQIDTTFQELQRALHRLEHEPAWVPLSWVLS
uniref:MAGUK p55 scaffold protein 7 n=1 Tax=Eptatretus burgeri TaxID=7764 RepID=A0A8C4N1Z1_EPTBU